MAHTLTIPVPQPFSFESTVVSHGWYLLAPFRWSREERLLRRAETIGSSAVDLTISHAKEALRIRSASKLQGALLPRINRMFQLHSDPSPFIATCKASSSHAWVAQTGFGRLLCGATLFEDIVKIIATTNTTWRQTVRMVGLLTEKCGSRTPQGHAAFPSPEQVIRFSEDELQNDCRLGYRAKTISSVARGFADGTIDPLAFRQDTATEELLRMYKALPGIGPYGAAHLLAMEGRFDFIAVDSEFRRFVRERYHGGRSVSDRTLLRHYTRWKEWQYLAYWAELWESVAPSLETFEAGAIAES